MPRLVGTVPRRRLGRILRELREDAGYTLDQAAELLETSLSRLSRLETAHQAPDVHWVRGMLDLYNAPQRWEELLTLARLAKKPGWWRAYGLGDRGYVPLEAAATEVREFNLTVVPGLLQTAEYTGALLRSGLAPPSESQLERDIEVRLRRQKRLYAEEDPLRLAAIVDESVLHRRVGNGKILQAQLDHLLMMAELDTVTIQVLPLGAPDRPGVDSGFTLLRFPEFDEPDLAYVEYIAGAAHIERVDELAQCRLAFDRLLSAALSPADSATLLERLTSAG